jgi:endonuclease YncB( thermonuclease family)
MLRLLLVIALQVLCFFPAVASDRGAQIELPNSGVVTEIVDGDTVVIAQDSGGSTQIRLSGIQAPKPSLGHDSSGLASLALTARETLQALILNHVVSLKFHDQGFDRHGRLVAHLYRDDGVWVQGEMLRRGMARVQTFDENQALAREMLELEQKARSETVGIWNDPMYAVRSPEQASRDVGSFQIVEGRAVKATRIKNHIYINFGDNWRTDFTVSVSTKKLPLFENVGIELLKLKGENIRVRGWLEEYNGPMINMTHPQQIEILANKPS